MAQKSGTTGVFVNLHRSPLRVVFRRRVDYRWDRYDVFKPWEKIDAVVMVIEELAKENPSFTEKLISVDEKQYRSSSHRTRHYVHNDRDQLYGANRKDLAEKFSRKVAGVWLGTNLNSQVMLQVIKEACEAAEIEYGPLSSLKW
ncbi:MAG: hypothetical protein ACK4UX_12880 [Thiobacillus sp.]